MDVASGYEAFMEGFADGLEPDPELKLDEWSEEHIIVPRETSATPGLYRADKTVCAREALQWLSPAHPKQRIVLVLASQFFKTQIAINAICGWATVAPANILALEPTLNLSKRLSSRISKTIEKSASVADKFGTETRADAKNTVDTKEFDGGTLYITTAGSAANLAEVPARYLFGDEIDRWDGDVGGEGDPVKLAEARTNTYRHTRKMYYCSSPTKVGASRIMELHDQGTQCVCKVPCPHCHEYIALEQEHLGWNEELTRAWINCPACGAEIDEGSKDAMFAPGVYRIEAQAVGDGETESLRVPAFYMPPGRITWLDMAKEFVAAEKWLEEGTEDPDKLMRTYYNTRLALPYSRVTEVAKPLDLAKRAEAYPEFSVPRGGMVLTAGVDVQHDRLAVVIRAWGRGEESWLVHWGEIHGQTLVADAGAWPDLAGLLFQPFRHASGAELHVKAVSVDSGDGVTQDAVYSFCRKWRARNVMATKGASEGQKERNSKASKKREIFAPPKPSVDVDRKQKAWKYGLRPFFVGTHAAKNLLLKVRLQLEGSGPGRLHWYQRVRADYWDQLTSEVEVPGKSRGETAWEVKAGVRNEGLDCEVLALHAARSLKLNILPEHVWAALEAQLQQAQLFSAQQPEPQAPVSLAPADTPAAAEPAVQVEQVQREPKPPALPPLAAPLPVSPAKETQDPPREERWLDDHIDWLD